MGQKHQLVSTALLMVGVGLVFAGMTSALHFTPAGMVATVATIAGLLYAGGVWFGSAAMVDGSIVIFDRRLIAVSGSHPGRPVSDMFPLHMRRDVEQRCREAFDGRSTRFSIPGDAERRRFEVAPIRTADGLIAYGILLSGAFVRAAAQELTPVA
jgi:hypothetical protein